MTTDDADVLAVRECEWESSAERTRRGERAAGSQIACAWAEGFQVGLALARAWDPGARTDTLSGAGKVVLRPRPEQGLGLTLAWEWARLRESGAPRHGQARALALIASQAVGPRGLLHFNLGLRHVRPVRETERFWALGAEWRLREGLELLAETHGSAHSKPQHALGLRLQAGGAWSLGLMATRPREQPRDPAVLLSARLGF